MDGTGAILLELYRAARESPILEFQDRTVSILRRACRFDAIVSGTATIDPKHGLVFQNTHLYNVDGAFLSAYEEVSEEDLVAREVAKRAGSVCVVNLRELMPTRRYPRVAAVDKRFGLQNVLALMQMDAASGAVSGCYVWRSRIKDRFSAVERRIGEALLPHVVEAGSVNRSIWLNQLTGNTIARRGTRAISTLDGVLQAHDPRFLDLLRTEWPDWSPPRLPAALTTALRSTRHKGFSGAAITVATAVQHGMLFLLAREKAGAYGLTPAQLAVARLVAGGGSYKEVAGRLGLSVATVRNHLQAAYAKLGVHNKAALAHVLANGGRRSSDPDQ